MTTTTSLTSCTVEPAANKRTNEKDRNNDQTMKSAIRVTGSYIPEGATITRTVSLLIVDGFTSNLDLHECLENRRLTFVACSTVRIAERRCCHHLNLLGRKMYRDVAISGQFYCLCHPHEREGVSLLLMQKEESGI